MLNKISENINNLTRAQLFQFLAHLVYIILSLRISTIPLGQIKAISLSYVFAFVVYFIYFAISKTKNSFSLISFFIICNSTYLNSYYDSEKIWVIPTVCLVSILAKLYFRELGKSIINPSFVGIFIISFLFPNILSYGAHYWSSQFWEIIIFMSIGTIVAYQAKTIRISYSYLIAWTIIYFLIIIIEAFTSKQSLISVDDRTN